VEKWLLLDRIALHSPNVAPWNVERPAAVEANLADAGLAVGNWAAVSAGETAHAIASEFLHEAGVGLSNALIQNVAEGSHDSILRRRNRPVCVVQLT
jgi:hypothetical protein